MRGSRPGRRQRVQREQMGTSRGTLWPEAGRMILQSKVGRVADPGGEAMKLVSASFV